MQTIRSSQTEQTDGDKPVRDGRDEDAKRQKIVKAVDATEWGSVERRRLATAAGARGARLEPGVLKHR